VFDLDRIGRRATAFVAGARDVFPGATFAYPFKANPMAAVAGRALAVYGHAEVATAEELALAEAYGCGPVDCLLGGVAKSAAQLASALARGSTVKLDSLTEVARLREIWPAVAVHEDARVLLRIAVPEPDRMSRFGLPVDDACAVVASGEPWTQALAGVHFHAGTSLQDPEPYAAATTWCAPALAAVARRMGDRRPVLDVGGGYPNRPDGDVAAVASRYAGAVADTLAGHGWAPDAVDLVFEPGRVTVERAGYLVAGVVDPSDRSGRPAVLVDAGSTLAGGSWAPVRRGRAAVLVGADLAHLPDSCEVYGNLCHEDDVVAEAAVVVHDGRARPIVIAGDVGAYRLSAAAAWMQQLPVVYALGEDGLTVLRHAVPLADLS